MFEVGLLVRRPPNAWMLLIVLRAYLSPRRFMRLSGWVYGALRVIV